MKEANSIQEYQKLVNSLRNQVGKYQNLFYEYRMKYEKITGDNNYRKADMFNNSMERRVVRILSDYYHVDISKNTDKRIQLLKDARHIAMWFMRTKLNMTLAFSGSVFNKDHATVLHACKKVKEAYETNYTPMTKVADYLVEQWYESNVKDNCNDIYYVPRVRTRKEILQRRKRCA